MNDDNMKEFAALELDKVIAASADMQQRWHDSIDAAAEREAATQYSTHRGFSPMSFFWGAAITAALAIGIGVAVFLADRPRSTETVDYVVQELPGSGLDRQATFSRALQVHLYDTQQSIATIPGNSAEERALLALQIVQQNRLFVQAAERHDADNLARVLRAFEPILLRLAADDIAPADADALRAQLAFEMKIMLTKLGRDSSNESHST
ncbi:MAG: hypothetical protein OEW64_06280 [Gammaproteobacteria bacterium]|nr:hypothetical protein [Gammaproteobacteria bacterium]MDH5303685.1 hypothetical protein [Gammaproteobacteria bacterium]MDH5322387.1 hypothetical protein [Gammaproteobacteria bacterium]